MSSLVSDIHLFGRTNEVPVSIQGCDATALLDTGSTVSTMSTSFCKQLNLQQNGLNDFIEIEGANGQCVPYEGYVVAQLCVPDLQLDMPALFLVVPVTQYSQTVPILLGTNILEQVQLQHREQNMTIHKLPPAWNLVFKTLHIQDRNLKRSGGQIGVAKCIAKRMITLPRNKSVILPVKIKDHFEYRPCLGQLDAIGSSLPDTVEISSVIVRHMVGNEVLPMKIVNHGDDTVHINPNEVVGSLHKVQREYR